MLAQPMKAGSASVSGSGTEDLLCLEIKFDVETEYIEDACRNYTTSFAGNQVAPFIALILSAQNSENLTLEQSTTQSVRS